MCIIFWLIFYREMYIYILKTQWNIFLKSNMWGKKYK